MPSLTHKTIRVKGIVQGVGFRPTVWRHAQDCGVVGYVANDTQGVIIECAGTQSQMDDFIVKIKNEPPPQAVVLSFTAEQLKPREQFSTFVIRPSEDTQGVDTCISPDLASCADCIDDILQVDNRRHSYPFTNCTHCGPRLSIIKSLPYDRKNTTMSNFTMCTACQHEYDDAANRRFHAQPNACAECGPQLSYSLEQAIRQLKEGKIVAIKGIGGFHLAVDACNEQAVSRLRRLKHRPDKPFALMAKNIQSILPYAVLTTGAIKQLNSSAAPIVLLAKKTPERLAKSVAPEQLMLGFMLPHSPLHHLLFESFDTPLIMTSANRSGQPQCIDNLQATTELAGIADHVLSHNREIINRVDDSLIMMNNELPMMLRRFRGYAPSPFLLPPGFEMAPTILGLGGDLKNTFSLISHGKAIVSQHIGDLSNEETMQNFHHSLNLYLNAYRLTPTIIAMDQHPQYHINLAAKKTSLLKSTKHLKVQHHHAHIAACLGEHKIAREYPPVLAVAFDGLGYSEQESDIGHCLWGGEIFIANYSHATRIAGLKPVALIGGERAMIEPWRNTIAQLDSAIGWNRVVADYGHLSQIAELCSHPVSVYQQMLDKQINCPLSSSAGRLFEAMAGLLGINSLVEQSYEGQAATALMNLMTEQDWIQAKEAGYRFELIKQKGHIQIDSSSCWLQVLDDLNQGCEKGVISAKFHQGLAQVIVLVISRLANLSESNKVVLTGGVFQNIRLLDYCTQLLTDEGFAVLTHQQIPANDGGLSLGQGLVAAAQVIASPDGV